ncbi:zinc finger protein 782-like [Hyposmocoma kahamanoa]|uniref:zinc finger protein 782-like n=1 Tax=Hyposmocoma kahamanoa TaxID=1477025 RepID=UPI000E6D79F3|nr:zinc finger protein 782-like [Hyposmocoma kahamanoa]
MDKCRICLNNRKTIMSIFENVKGMCYADMMTAIANVKISKDQQITDKICRMCRRKLKEAYEFKILIEKSDATLCEITNLKKVSFNNLNDIKIKIEIENIIDSKPLVPNYNDFKLCFQKDINELLYGNTVIKKVEHKHKDVSMEPMPGIKFVKTIKDEPDDHHFDDDYDIDQENYSPESDSEYLPIQELLKKSKRRRYQKHKQKKLRTTNKERKVSKTYRTNINEEKMTTFIKPMKPIYIGDLRLIRTYLKKPKAETKKQKYQVKARICPHCGLLTKSLNSHMLQHIGEKKFKCDRCEKAFFTNSALQKHLVKHSATKNYKCDQCTAEFHENVSLKSHMLTHSQEKKHVCDVCSKAFKRRGALRRHLLIHSAKKIKCEQCNMSFNTKYNMRHHMRVHTGERPFNCEICSQPYSYKHDFNRHCFKKHGVFLKRRSVYVMNEEVLKQEKQLMRDLMLRVSGVIKDDKPLNPFEGPQAARAFEHAVKALENGQIPIDFQL